MIFEQKKYYVCCSKLWIPQMAEVLTKKSGIPFQLITTKVELAEVIKNPETQTLFFPHWSYILKEDAFKKHNCIMFHMTDLPFGRGGSPLQNLIIRGHKQTKISAFFCDGGVDTGPVFMKKDLSLDGSAQEIFVKANSQMVEMILEMLKTKPQPQKQIGEVVEFKRRTPEMSELTLAESYEQIYDMIRMLDADGYPKAFLKTAQGTFYFEKAQLENGEIVAQVRIKK